MIGETIRGLELIDEFDINDIDDIEVKKKHFLVKNT